MNIKQLMKFVSLVARFCTIMFRTFTCHITNNVSDHTFCLKRVKSSKVKNETYLVTKLNILIIGNTEVS